MRTFPKEHKEVISEISKIGKHGFVAVVARSDEYERLPRYKKDDIEANYPWAKGFYKVTYTPDMYVKPSLEDFKTATENAQVKSGAKKGYDVEESRISRQIEGFPNGVLREAKPKMVVNKETGLEENVNEGKFYVRLYCNNSGKRPENRYYNEDGVDITDRIDENFRKKFFKKDYGSKKQLNAGISKENQIKPREYKLQNIIYLWSGDCQFNGLSDSLLADFDLELRD